MDRGRRAWMLAAALWAGCVEGNPDFGSDTETGGAGGSDSATAGTGPTSAPGSDTDIDSAGGSGGTSCPDPICFSEPIPWAIALDALDVAAGRFDGDRDLDLVVAFEGGVIALLGRGDGGPGTASLLERGNFLASRVVVADFDGDGLDDVAYSRSPEGIVVVEHASATGLFVDESEVAVGVNPLGVGVADVDDDGRIDLAAAVRGEDTVDILLGQAMPPPWFAQIDALAVGVPSEVLGVDANGDGRGDFALVNGDEASLLLSEPGGTWTTIEYLQGTQPIAVASSDFDGDGIFDLGLPTTTPPELRILLGDGQAYDESGPRAALTRPAGDIAAGDLDGDGITDLVLADLGVPSATVLHGTGGATFTATVLSLPAAASALTLADLDGDGKDDIAFAVAAIDGGVSVMLSQ